MYNLFEKPTPPENKDTQKLARVLLLKTLARWILYALGLLAAGVVAIFWFIGAVLAQPFKESGGK